MSTANFELHKVKREIQIHGKQYEFLREKADKYGEPTNERPEKVATVCGLFHITKGYVSKTVQDATMIHAKGQPMLLAIYEDVSGIQNGDFFVLNNNTYKVIEKNNIQECGIVCDISLEVVLDGRN